MAETLIWRGCGRRKELREVTGPEMGVRKSFGKTLGISRESNRTKPRVLSRVDVTKISAHLISRDCVVRACVRASGSHLLFLSSLPIQGYTIPQIPYLPLSVHTHLHSCPPLPSSRHLRPLSEFLSSSLSLYSTCPLYSSRIPPPPPQRQILSPLSPA